MTIPTMRLRFNPDTPRLRARVLPSIPALQVQLRNSGTAIEWRVGLSGTWEELVQISDLDVTVTIGSVTALPAGSPATVTNSGTASDIILDFGIPAGADGADGLVTTIEQGTGITVDATDPAHPIVSVTAGIYQPIDADLSAIAALTTAAWGRSLLTMASEFALLAAMDNARAPIATNLKLAASVSSNALTVALKTLAGADPSSSDQIVIPYRNASGGIDWIELVAATSIVISSGSTLGVPASTPFRIWAVSFNDGGGNRLALINCLSGTDIFPLGNGLTASSSVDNGVGNADSTHTFYTTGAGATSKPYTILGYLDWDTGLGTPGTWSAGPDRTIVFGDGVKRPGDVVQTCRSTVGSRVSGTTTTPFDNTTPQSGEGNEVLSKAITPTKKQNVLGIRANVFCGCSAANNSVVALFQDSGADALAVGFGPQIAAGGVTGVPFEHRMKAGTVASTTFKIRIGGNAAGTFDLNGTGSAAIFNGTLASQLVIEELMA